MRVAIRGTFVLVMSMAGLAAFSADKLYWTDRGTGGSVHRADPDGSSVEDLVDLALDPPLVRPAAIALDAGNGRFYWSEPGLIRRSNLDGSGTEVVLSAPSFQLNPSDIALDPAGGKMYWTDDGLREIRRANLDGSGAQTLASVSSAPELELDLSNGKVYWTDRLADNIRRANLDGSNIEDIHVDLFEPVGLALDVVGGKMYWTEPSGSAPGKIMRSDLDGSNAEFLLTSEGRSLQLDVPAGKMYWTDFAANKIQRANLDGTGVEDVVSTGTPLILALDLVSAEMYWTDIEFDQIKRATLAGTNIEVLVTGFRPVGIATDANAGHLYLSDAATAQITRYDLDGSNPVKVADSPIVFPGNDLRDVELDLNNGKVYWNESTAIYRANLDGSVIEQVYDAFSLNSIGGIVLDVPNDSLYWTEPQFCIFPPCPQDTVRRSALDGSGNTSIVSAPANGGIDIDRANGKLYWSDTGGVIRRINLDGTGLETIVNAGFNHAGSIYLYDGHVYWTDPVDGAIRRANLDGSSIVDIVTGLIEPQSIAFGPDTAMAPLLCDVEASQAVFVPGDIIGLSLLRYANPTIETATDTRLRLQLRFGTFFEANFINAGPFDLPSSFDLSVNDIDLAGLPPLPAGVWSFRCVMEDFYTGDVLAEDVATFGIQ